jgi:glycosyltransferase involved in cell wall biosynthesis
MKIAFIYDAVYPWIKGGAEKRVYEIARRLVVRGHEVHWYGVGWWKNDVDCRDIIDHDGIILHGVCSPIDLYTDGRRSIGEALKFSQSLLPKLMSEDFDIIDCQEFPYFPSYVTKLHSIIKGSRMVITWYEVWDDYWVDYLGSKGRIGKLVEKSTTKLPELVVPISDKIKMDLYRLNVDDTVMRTVPNGVDFDRLQKIKPSKEQFDVIYFGRLISHKKVDVLVRAISAVKKEIPDVSCAIIGEGPDREKIENLVNELNLRDNITLFGFIERDEDVLSRVKSSRIFVLPSIREGFPNTILEANSCGLPAIIVNHEKNAGVGVVQNDYNGYVVELDPQEIADKIRYILSNESILSKLRINACEFGKNHDWNIIVEKIESVYTEVLA